MNSVNPRIDPDGIRLPIKLDTTSNGEFEPVPLSPANNAANHLAHEAADANAKRLTVSRRDFLISACGAASTLLAFNAANAIAGKTGGFFDLPAEAALEPSLAQALIGGDKSEFIFDVQGHFVDPNGAWLQNLPAGSDPLSQMPKAGCALAAEPGSRSYLRCLGPEEFIKDIFLDSDTDMMVLSFIPSKPDAASHSPSRRRTRCAESSIEWKACIAYCFMAASIQIKLATSTQWMN